MWCDTIAWTNDSVHKLQAQLQKISQQLNEQVAEYLDKGFELKDVSSGMTKGSGEHCAMQACGWLLVEDAVLNATSTLACRDE